MKTTLTGEIARLLRTPAHRMGEPLSGPLSAYGPVVKGNLHIALSLEYKYLADAIKRSNLREVIRHTRIVLSLEKACEEQEVAA